MSSFGKERDDGHSSHGPGAPAPEDQGLCPRPNSCVADRGDCGREKCANRPAGKPPPDKRDSEIHRLTAEAESKAAVLRGLRELVVKTLGSDHNLTLTTAGAIRELGKRLEAAEASLINEQIYIEQLRDEIVEAWHRNAYGDRELSECLGMTEEQYGDWLLDGAFSRSSLVEEQPPEPAHDSSSPLVECFSPAIQPGVSPLSDRAVMVEAPEGAYVLRSDYERLQRDLDEIAESLQHESDENFDRAERWRREASGMGDSDLTPSGGDQSIEEIRRRLSIINALQPSETTINYVQGEIYEILKLLPTD